MKRPHDIPTDGSDDPIPAGEKGYDSFVEVARDTQRNARIVIFIGGTLALLGISQEVYRLVVPGPMPVVAEMCRGTVITVRSAETLSRRPAIEDIRNDLIAWVRGAREVSSDLVFLGRQAFNTYHHTKKGSQAEAKLQAYHEKMKLNEVARTRTVYLESTTAFPQAGMDSNSWLVEWKERTTGRDGALISEIDYRMTISFVIAPQTTAEGVQKNPHGIFVESFDWEAPRNSRTPRVAEVGR